MSDIFDNYQFICPTFILINVYNFTPIILIYIISLLRKECFMNKEELVTEISKSAKVTKKEAEAVLSATIETIENTVKKGDKVTLVGFGTFEPRKRAARTGRNPQTGKEIKIAAKTVPAFSAGKKFKEAVAK